MSVVCVFVPSSRIEVFGKGLGFAARHVFHALGLVFLQKVHEDAEARKASRKARVGVHLFENAADFRDGESVFEPRFQSGLERGFIAVGREGRDGNDAFFADGERRVGGKRRCGNRSRADGGAQNFGGLGHKVSPFMPGKKNGGFRRSVERTDFAFVPSTDSSFGIIRIKNAGTLLLGVPACFLPISSAIRSALTGLAGRSRDGRKPDSQDRSGVLPARFSSVTGSPRAGRSVVTTKAPSRTRRSAKGLSQVKTSMPMRMAVAEATIGCRFI